MIKLSISSCKISKLGLPVLEFIASLGLVFFCAFASTVQPQPHKYKFFT